VAKKTGLRQTLFADIDPYGEKPSPATSEGALTVALPIIRPDPEQPRRLLPSDLAADVASGRLTPSQAMAQWLAQNHSVTDEDYDQAPAASRQWLELRRLAESIAQHGLINAITVRRVPASLAVAPGVEYLIVTGERRYWAHILLQIEGRTIQDGVQQRAPDQIKVAIAADDISVRAHQLIENLMRADINAMEKAQGLLALRYELSGVTYRLPDASTQNSDRLPGENDDQLAPWTAVQASLGISKQHRIRLTNLLNLRPDVQALIAEHGLAEMTIRPVVQKLRDYPELQLAALEQLIAWQQQNDQGNDKEGNLPIVASVQSLVDQLLGEQAAAGEPAGKLFRQRRVASRPIQQFQRTVDTTLRFLDKFSGAKRAALITTLQGSPDQASAVQNLRHIRDELDAILLALEEQF
jgi:ParB-like chromosome segregation protein Spo0J